MQFGLTYEVISTDPAVDEIEKRLDSEVRTEIIITCNTSRKDVHQQTIPTCDVQEQEPESLPTPVVTPERDLQASEIQLVAGGVADIAREAQNSPVNLIANPTTQSDVMSENTQQGGRTRHEAGHYEKLAIEAIEYALSAMKIKHQMNNIQKIYMPNNFLRHENDLTMISNGYLR